MPRLSPEETRSRILEASLRLFQEQGFRETTMRQVASEVGIALGTTYNYFPTKEQIALYFFEDAMERVFRRFDAEDPPGAALDERLFLLLTLELEEIEPYEELLTVLVFQSAAPSSRLHPASLESRRLRNRFLDRVSGLVEDAYERGDLPRMGYEQMVLDAFWIFHLGIMTFWLNDTSPGKEDTLVLLDKSLRFVLKALREGEAP